MKKTLIISTMTIVGSIAGQAALVAGWETWGETAPGNDTYLPTVVNSATGLAEGTVTGTSGSIGNFTNATPLFGASTDGTWGTIAAPAASTATASATAAVGVLNEANGFFDFTVTAVGSTIEFTSFNFDSYRRFGGSADSWALSVASGDITTGPVGSGSITQAATGGSTMADTANTDFDVDLSTLGDRTLLPGESAVFRLEFTGGDDANGGGNNTMIDNVGVFGDIVAIPEPSSSLLALLSGGLLIIRRRR